MTGELEALNSPDLAPWEPTDPNGASVTRVADDVDKVQARLLEERAHRLAYRDRNIALEDELARVRRRNRGHKADVILALLVGVVTGFLTLGVVLVYLLP